MNNQDKLILILDGFAFLTYDQCTMYNVKCTVYNVHGKIWRLIHETHDLTSVPEEKTWAPDILFIIKLRVLTEKSIY